MTNLFYWKICMRIQYLVFEFGKNIHSWKTQISEKYCMWLFFTMEIEESFYETPSKNFNIKIINWIICTAFNFAAFSGHLASQKMRNVIFRNRFFLSIKINSDNDQIRHSRALRMNSNYFTSITQLFLKILIKNPD